MLNCIDIDMSHRGSPDELFPHAVTSENMEEETVQPPTASASCDVEEIDRAHASWALSSAKPGNGIEQLLDDNPDTFWQSDGGQPHLVTVSFYKKTKVSDIWIYLNYRSDESYTPQQISVRIGSSHHDLQEVQVVDLREPEGWIRIPLAVPPASKSRTLVRQDSASIRDKSFGGAFDFIRCFSIQIAVLSNHQNGRDTHIRCVKLFGPKSHESKRLAPVTHAQTGIIERLDRGIGMYTPEMLSFISIR